MTFFAHANVLDHGPANIRDNCDKLALISAYTFGDSYATVSAAILAAVDMEFEHFTLANAADNGRKLVTDADLTAEATATVAASATKHFAFLDTTSSAVLWVTPETTGQAITAGNPVIFPSLEYHAFQPEALG